MAKIRKSSSDYPDLYHAILRKVLAEGKASVTCQTTSRRNSVRDTFYAFRKTILQARNPEEQEWIEMLPKISVQTEGSKGLRFVHSVEDTSAILS
jgi:hypothetical protein